MDTLLPSSRTYKVNARVNNIPLDELSFISSGNKIWPFFENSISGDPDVTALTLFLRDSRGETVGWKAVYTLGTATNSTGQAQVQVQAENNDDDKDTPETEQESGETEEPQEVEAIATFRNGEELIIPVKSLDYNLPYFPIPDNLPMGRYSLVSQVMRGNQVLQRNEKSFFYLADVKFSLESIQVHHGGISMSSQLVQKKTFIMLEAKLDFDSRLDPYIVWYNGKRIIGEGSFSQGAGNLLWRAPDQTGFTSIRAEVFPVKDRQDLAGYSRDISLLVSDKKNDMHLLSEDNADVLYWYIFEGTLDETKSNGSPERVLRHSRNVSPRWMPASGTFALASGSSDIYTLPGISSSNSEDMMWQILCRIKPLNDGGILSIQFGASSAVTINLIKNGKNLSLMLISPAEVVSQTLSMPQTDSFLIVEINFSIRQDFLTVNFDIFEDFNDQREAASETITVQTQLNNEFLVTLGSQLVNNSAAFSSGRSAQPAIFTVLWDEFALLHLPYAENKFIGEVMEVQSARDESSEEISLGEEDRRRPGVSGSLA